MLHYERRGILEIVLDFNSPGARLVNLAGYRAIFVCPLQAGPGLFFGQVPGTGDGRFLQVFLALLGDNNHFLQYILGCGGQTDRCRQCDCPENLREALSRR